MAGQEDLGKAVLRLSVDDSALISGIRDAKAFISKELGQAFTAGKGTSGRGRQSSGEKRFSDRAQATQVITRRLGDQLQRLSGRGIDVTKQFAALDRAGAALNKGLVEVARAQNKGVQDFIKNEQRKQAAAKRTQTVTGSTLRSPIQGSLRLPGSPIFSARGARLGGQRESIDALFQAKKRRYSLDQQIRSLEAANVNTDKQRAALGEITTAQAQRKFGLAKQLGDRLQFNLRKERDALNLRQRQAREDDRALRRAQQLGGPRSPIGGAAFIPGSPAAIAASARAGGPVSPIKGSKDLPGSPAFYEEQRRQLDKAIAAGGPSLPIKGLKSLPGSPAFYEEQQRQLDKAIAAGGPRSPIRGSKTLVGSPAFLEEQARRRRGRLQGLQGRISSGLVGGAFPLLFGQGAGAAIGGGLGGLAGGSKFGFGLSLVGTVLGQAFDQGIEKAKVLASALDSPVQNFQALADAGLISSKSLKNTIQALLETGRTAEAAALIQQDLASRQFDPEAIKELEENTQQLTNRWNDLSLTLAAVGAGPLSDIIAGFNKLLGGSVDRGNFANLDKEIAQAVALERKKIAAEQGTEKLAELDPQILEARFRNDKLRTAELEKQKLAIQKINALAAFGTTSDADKIRRQKVLNDFKLKELKIEQDIQRARTEQFIKQLQLKSAQGAFGATEASKVFDNAYIQITSALAQFGPASLEFKLALQEGANAVLESTKSAAEQLRDANRSLRDLRLGNLRFLPAGQRQELLREQAQKAIPEARRRGVALRGLGDVLSFNRFLEQEQSGLQARADAERNMTDANSNLRSEIVTQTGALTQLTTVMDRLIDKSWAVYVNVPSQNAASALNMANQLN